MVSLLVMSLTLHLIASGEAVRQSKLLALAPIIKVAALIFAQSRPGMAIIRCASNRSRAVRRVTSAIILPATISWMSRTDAFVAR
jgi:hypothetical protein